MLYHHLVFDPNLVVEAFFNPDESNEASILVDRAAGGVVSGWLPAQSLPWLMRALKSAMESRGATPEQAETATGAYLNTLCEHLFLLSLPGPESRELLPRARNLEQAQIALSAMALAGDACIVTRDSGFDTLGMIPAHTPRDILNGIRAETALPFIDLAAQKRRILPEVETRVRSVLRHGQYVMGPEVLELEAKLAQYVGTGHAITCSSGTDALLMALMAYEIGPGDAVLTTPFTFVATAEAISLVGATPVFVDIDPVTYNIDAAKLDLAIRALKSGDASIHPLPAQAKEGSLVPRAVIPVDLFGLPADYDAIQDICRNHDIRIIEDAAQSFGALYRGKRACALGDVGATSFFPAKPLGCYGDAGAVFTDDDGLAARMVSIRVHGQGSDKYENVRVGLNARMDTIQAAVLLAKLDVFDSELDLRQRVADRYDELFPREPLLRLPTVPEGSRSAWAQYTLASERRPAILKALSASGIPSAIYYPKPLHQQGAYRHLGYQNGDFPFSEAAATTVFSVPMHPYLTFDDSRRVTQAILLGLSSSASAGHGDEGAGGSATG